MSDTNGTQTLTQILGTLQTMALDVREIREGQARIEGRLENILSTSGAKMRELEARLEAVEARLR